MLILLWGLAGEAPLAAVHRELRRGGIRTVLVDQTDPEVEIQLTVGSEVTGWISVDDERVDLAAIDAAYLRPYDPRLLSTDDIDQDDLDLARTLKVDDILSIWSQTTSALVVNRLEAMATNNSKPYQLQLIRNFGFSIPPTLVTTDHEAAAEFWGRHGSIIYKSVSGTRSRVSRLQPQDHLRLLDVVSCPTQFQKYIPGIDHRVHVIGNEVFACELISDADDYRYPGQHSLEIRKCILPLEIEERCVAVAHAMDLPLAGVDLRRTPEGEWYCFEVNPSPAFTFYENATGQPMACAVAGLLSSTGTTGSWAGVASDSTINSFSTILTAPGVVEPVSWDL